MTTVAVAAPRAAAAGTSRLWGIDAARGVALLGMMAVHALNDEPVPGQASLEFQIFGGRAAAAFAVLSGVSIALMTGRRRVRPAEFGPTAAMLATRALAIGAIGLLLGYADARYAAVILPYYAILFLLAIPLVVLPTPAVAAVGVAVVAAVPVLTHRLQPLLPVPDLENPAFGDLFGHPLTLLSELTVTGEYPALSWTAYLCAGLVVGRLALRTARTATALLVTGVVMAVGATVVSWLLMHRFGGLARLLTAQPTGWRPFETTEILNLGGEGTTPAWSDWWLAVDGPHTGTPPDLVGTIGSAVALLGLLLLAAHLRNPGQARAVRMVLAPLAGAGSMTLTIYTLHIMFLNSPYDTYGAVTGYVLQVIAALLLGLGWRATAGKGPLEALVATLARRAGRLATRTGAPPGEPARAPGVAP